MYIRYKSFALLKTNRYIFNFLHKLFILSTIIITNELNPDDANYISHKKMQLLKVHSVNNNNNNSKLEESKLTEVGINGVRAYKPLEYKRIWLRGSPSIPGGVA